MRNPSKIWMRKFCYFSRKDSRLPEQLQRAMAAEAEAAREARAKIVRANGEQKATNALKEAASVLSESPSALQLRYLQVRLPISILNNFRSPFFSYIKGSFLIGSQSQSSLWTSCFFSSSDFEQHWQREKHHHHFPCSNRHPISFYGKRRLVQEWDKGFCTSQTRTCSFKEDWNTGSADCWGISWPATN